MLTTVFVQSLFSKVHLLVHWKVPPNFLCIYLSPVVTNSSFYLSAFSESFLILFLSNFAQFSIPGLPLPHPTSHPLSVLHITIPACINLFFFDIKNVFNISFLPGYMFTWISHKSPGGSLPSCTVMCK